MNTSQCAVYQVKEAPEYRNVRFRSYAKLKVKERGQGRKLSAGIYWKNPAGGNSGGYKNTLAETATEEL